MASPNPPPYTNPFQQQGYPAAPNYANSNNSVPPLPARNSGYGAGGHLSPNPVPPQGESASYYAPSPSQSPYPTNPNAPSPYYPPSQYPQSGPGISPVPSNDDLRHRLEAAGVSPAQIAQIMNPPPSPQPLPSPQFAQHAPTYATPPIQAMQNMTLQPPPMHQRRPSEQELLADPKFPENWPTDRPIILERREQSNTLEYIVPAGCSNDSRMYSYSLESRTERIRLDLIIQGHPKRQPNNTRRVAEIAYTQHGVWPTTAWLDWGEWQADKGTQTFSWSSDTGMLKEGEWMYWTKDLDREKTGKLAVFTCRIYQTGEQRIPKSDDKIICTVVMPDGKKETPTIITISPGYIRTLLHLDEMVTVANAVVTKYVFDIGMWLHFEKSFETADYYKLTDASFVPHDIDGFGCDDFKVTYSSKSGHSEKWSKRGKAFGKAAELGKGVLELSYQIGVATGSIAGS